MPESAAQHAPDPAPEASSPSTAPARPAPRPSGAPGYLRMRYQIAADCLCDLRTIDRALSGHPVSSSTRERIRTALAARGWGSLLPPEAAR